MDPENFRDFAKEMVDYVIEYLENIRERPVVPSVQPGYLAPLVPDEAPRHPENWQDIMKDIERVIMPGVAHWHSPRFHAYFPTGQSYPSIVADILSGAIACMGFTWIACPACTELEDVTLNWLGKLIELPKEFLSCGGGKGGGVIQTAASEATFVALLGAKAKKVSRIKKLHPEWTQNDIVGKLVAYGSREAHCSVERAGTLGGVQLRLLDTDSKNSMRGNTLLEAVREDKAKGLIPFFTVATLGTTSSCAFDHLDEIGVVCNEEEIWLHVDAAYAGSSFVCPEFRYLMKGIERVDSFNFNPHKWLLVNFDCSPMWFKDPSYIVDTFNVDPVYLRHEMQGSAPDYRHWQIPFGRRFRSLKLWFVLRLYGVENLQKHIRKHVAQAKEMEALMRADPRFEIVQEVILGFLCFRLKGPNELTKNLLKKIHEAANIHLIPSKIKDSFVLRLTIGSRFSESKDVHYSWREIKLRADEVFNEIPLTNGELKKYMNGSMIET